MIEVTLRDIIEGSEQMRQLMDVPLKSSVAYQIARLAREMEKELKTFDEARTKLVQKHGKKDKNGQLIIDENNQYTIEPNNIEQFNEEINELFNTKVELNVNLIKLNDLDCQLSPKKIVQLMPFIEE